MLTYENSKNTFDQPLFIVEVHTRFKSPFWIWAQQKYLKPTVCSVFYVLQNDVSHEKGTFKFHSLPLITTIRGWGGTPNYEYVKDNYRLPLVYVPNLFFLQL